MDTPTDATLWAKCNRRDLPPVSLFVPWPPSVELLHLASSLIANARQCPHIDQNWFPARAILITTPSEALLSGKPDTAMMQKDWRADISLDILPPPDNRFIAASCCCLMRGDRVVSRLDKSPPCQYARWTSLPCIGALVPCQYGHWYGSLSPCDTTTPLTTWELYHGSFLILPTSEYPCYHCIAFIFSVKTCLPQS